jgi:two-component system cell cycle sensor histidine kinase/response regulator CckA
LAQSEEKYRDLVENINDVLYAVDRQGVITYISPVIESTLGYRTDELIGNCFLDYVYEQDRTRLQGDFAKALEVTGNPREYRFLDKYGETRWCRVSSRVITGAEGGGKLGIQGVLVDITHSKQLEEQLQRAQKMEALGTLAGGVAHDLNNILTGIVSYPELLLMDVPEESPLWQPLNTIKKSGENAAAIVQDLLTLARRGVATLELVNLNQIVHRCLDSPEIRSLMRQHADIRLTISLQSDLFNVYGSEIHIYKSFLNLVFNAVEAMPKGGSLVIATANRYADKVVSGFDTVREGEYVVLSIADSGVGIAESDRARIFEPFYTRKVMGRSGSGLGMAVVWGTVKDHNGYIDLQSEEGRGTRFELIFPATRDEMKKLSEAEAPSDFTGNGEFILVVDDMQAQREIATSILERLGYRCQAVPSGEEALEFLREHTADLVVLDMIMNPGMDGYETYRQMQGIRPGQKAIMASGYSETERVRKAQQLGAGKYIKKPYTLTAIGKAIKEELQRS